MADRFVGGKSFMCLLQNLVKDETTTNAEAIKFAQTNMLNKDYYDDNDESPAKNNDVSRGLRCLGNAMFDNKNFANAHHLYNQSICMAEPGSQELSIAFANRSAVFMEINHPESCIKDIRSARGVSKFPKKLKAKLEAREKMCLEMIKSGSSVIRMERFKPFVQPYLERLENEEYGRFIATTRLINPGDVLLTEDSFACVPMPNLRFRRCWHCMAVNRKYLIPCKNCSEVMFCSMECLDAAQATYHSIECPSICALLKLMSGKELLALRIVLKGVFAFGSISNIGKFIEKHGDTKVDSFSTAIDGLYSNQDQRKFHELYSLPVHQDKHIGAGRFNITVLAARVFDSVVKQTPWAQEIESNETAYNVFAELLFHFLYSCISNFPEFELDLLSSRGFTVVGAFPLASLLNHSCAPNVMRIMHHNSQQSVVALRVIKAGEQLFDCYGPNHYDTPAIRRQMQINDQFCFFCKCIACKSNYPILEKLRVAEITHITKDSSGDFNVEILKAYLKKYDQHYPCEQLNMNGRLLKSYFLGMFDDEMENCFLEIL